MIFSRKLANGQTFDDRAETGNGFLAINNCLNEVCHGFRLAPEEWDRWFDTSISEVEATYRR